jgi:hypothetical protein
MAEQQRAAVRRALRLERLDRARRRDRVGD